MVLSSRSSSQGACHIVRPSFVTVTSQKQGGIWFNFLLNLLPLHGIEPSATDSGASGNTVAAACAPQRPVHHGKAHPHHKGLPPKAGALFR